MAKATSKTNKKAPGKISSFFSFLGSAIGVLLISIILSIVIEWLGVTFNFWHEQGYHHAKKMFNTELNWVLGDFLPKDSIYANIFINVFEFSYTWLIDKSGLIYLSSVDLIAQYILSAIYIIQVVLVRLLVILCAIPAFIVINVITTVDGMYIRQLRKFGGATESAFLYHHSKRWIKPIISLLIVLMLASPFSVHPSVFILTISLVPGFFLWLSVAYFKKYL